MNFKKIKKFVTALAFSFLALFLFSFLSPLFNFNIGIENNKLIISQNKKIAWIEQRGVN